MFLREFFKMHKKIWKLENLIYLFIVLGLAVRLIFVFEPGFVPDINWVKSWVLDLATNGFWQFYQRVDCDYPPFYMYVLKIVGEVYVYLTSIWRPSDKLYLLLHKAPVFFADMATGYLIFYWLKREISLKAALWGAALYLFNPVVLYNGAIWGQVDGFYVFVQLLSFFFSYFQKPILGITFGFFAALTKPQGLILLPLILLWVWRKHGAKLSLEGLGVGILLSFMVLYPFNGGDFSFLIQNYLRAADRYPFGSVNGFNLWWLIKGNWVPDDTKFWLFTWRNWGLLFFGIIYLFAFVLASVKSRKYDLIIAAAMILMGMFLFSTRMHERYSIYAIPFLTLCCFFPKIRILPLVILFCWGISSLINIHWVLGWKIPLGGFLLGKNWPFVSIWLGFLAFFAIFVDFLKNKLITLKQ